MKRKKLLILTVLLIAFIAVFGQTSSQELISCIGENYKNSVYQLDWSVGELMTETYSNSQIILTQGFHQGKYTVTAVEQQKDIGCEISIFPNPATDFVTVKLDRSNYKSINYCLVDVNGKIIQNNQLYDNQKQINLGGLAGGDYFLNISSNGKILKAFKIIKLITL